MRPAPIFAPSSSRAPASPATTPHEHDDPIAAVLREHPEAQHLTRELSALASRLQEALPADPWVTFLDYERTMNAYAAVAEHVIFDHGFRMGQLWPPIPDTEDALRNCALHRLAHAATDRRTPPGQRLRVLFAAAVQALEELFATARLH